MLVCIQAKIVNQKEREKTRGGRKGENIYFYSKNIG
jgi:hypothetical protein